MRTDDSNAPKKKRKSGKKNASLSLPEMALNCLPPFALTGGFGYGMDKYWETDLEGPDSNVLIMLFVAFWGFAVGWIYLVDFIKKRVDFRWSPKTDRLDTGAG